MSLPRSESFVKNRLTLRGVLLILVLTGLYFACYFSLNTKMRLALIGGVVGITALLVFSEPGSWMPVLPLILTAGGATIHLGEFNPAVATLIMLLFTFFYVASRVLWNRSLFVPSPYLGLLVVALLIQVVSIFISIHVNEQYPLNAIRDGSSLFLFFPLAVMVPVFTRTTDDVRKMHRALVVTAGILSLIGIFQYFTLKGFYRVDMSIGYIYKGRVASLFDNPNIFAGYLEMSIPLAIALFFREKSLKWRLVSMATIVMGILSVLYTFSRGGLFGVFLGCGLTLLYIFRRRVWIPIIMGIAAVAILVMNADTFQRQMSFFMSPEENIYQPTILHRFVTYKGFIRQAKETPLLGVGYGAREYYWGRSRLYSFWEVRFARSTSPIMSFGGLNSLFLNNLVKGGAVSLLSLLLVFVAIYAASYRILKDRGKLTTLCVAITAGMLSFNAHQFVGNQLRFPTVNAIFWFTAGLLIAIACIVKEQNAAIDLPTADDEGSMT